MIVLAAIRRGSAAVGQALFATTAVTAAWLGLSAILLLWRWSQIPFIVFGFAPFVGGYVVFCAALTRTRSMRPTLLGAGYDRIDRWTGTVVMFALHTTLALLPLCVGITVAQLGPPSASRAIMTAAALISAPVWLAVTARLVVLPAAAATLPADATTQAVFIRAQALTEPRRWQALALLAYVLTLGGITWLSNGILAPVAVPLAACTVIAFYDLAESEDGPAASSFADPAPHHTDVQPAAPRPPPPMR